MAVAMVQAGTASGPPKPFEAVDLNRATVAQLLKLNGITETWARRIVRFRPYRSKLELLNEGVVTPEVYQRIRDQVVAHRMVANGAGDGQR